MGTFLLITAGILLLVYVVWALLPAKKKHKKILREIKGRDQVFLPMQGITETNLSEDDVDISHVKFDAVITRGSIIFLKISGGTQLYLKSMSTRRLKSVGRFIPMRELKVTKDGKSLSFNFKPPNTKYGSLFNWELQDVLQSPDKVKILELLGLS